jgi:predicted anti-sigma-YlaC factor YlaD
MKRLIPACRDMSELATGYMEGALPVPLRLRARLHLLLCEPCRRYYDQLRRTVALLSGRRVAVDPGIEDRIIAAATRKD